MGLAGNRYVLFEDEAENGVWEALPEVFHILLLPGAC